MVVYTLRMFHIINARGGMPKPRILGKSIGWSCFIYNTKRTLLLIVSTRTKPIELIEALLVASLH